MEPWNIRQIKKEKQTLTRLHWNDLESSLALHLMEALILSRTSTFGWKKKWCFNSSSNGFWPPVPTQSPYFVTRVRTQISNLAHGDNKQTPFCDDVTRVDSGAFVLNTRQLYINKSVSWRHMQGPKFAKLRLIVLGAAMSDINTPSANTPFAPLDPRVDPNEINGPFFQNPSGGSKLMSTALTCDPWPQQRHFQPHNRCSLGEIPSLKHTPAARQAPTAAFTAFKVTWTHLSPTTQCSLWTSPCLHDRVH